MPDSELTSHGLERSERRFGGDHETHGFAGMYDLAESFEQQIDTLIGGEIAGEDQFLGLGTITNSLGPASEELSLDPAGDDADALRR